MEPVTLAPHCRPGWAWPLRAIGAEAKKNVVVVAGDAAFTCGTSYEALNNVSHNTKRLLLS